jgi:hypothetical protein
MINFEKIVLKHDSRTMSNYEGITIFFQIVHNLTTNKINYVLHDDIKF